MMSAKETGFKPLACRLCHDQQVKSLGTIPDGDVFAGRVLGQPIPGGELWRCNACESMFRHPILSDERYLSLYSAGASESWNAKEDRNDLAAVRKQIMLREADCSVLDVGCGTGGFLLTLPASTRKFGIEPSLEAAAAASAAGISISGRTFHDLDRSLLFDIITIVDVIEHVADPLNFLDLAAAHLKPGGSLIITSGDPSFWLWRFLFRSRFWYSSFPEHISFPSRRLLDVWRRRREMEEPRVMRIRYRVVTPWKAAAHMCMMMVYLASPVLLNALGRAVDWLRAAQPPRRRCFSPGAPGIFVDHHVVILSRPK